MPSVIFVKRDGSEVTVEADAGLSIMEIGRDNGIGIEGTCGGSLSCATCHVVVDEAWVEATGNLHQMKKICLILLSVWKKHHALAVRSS